MFSLEESKEMVINRMLSMQAMVDSNKMRTGKLEEEDWTKLEGVIEPLSEAQIYIDDTPGISAMKIREKSIELKDEKDIGLIFIDYLQLISERDKEEVDYNNTLQIISNLAKELNIAILLTSQLSRKPEQRKDHTPRLSDFVNSHAVTEYADTILFIYRDDYYNPDSEKNIADIIIKRSTHGSIGVVKLIWDSRYMKFSNLKNI